MDKIIFKGEKSEEFIKNIEKYARYQNSSKENIQKIQKLKDLLIYKADKWFNGFDERDIRIDDDYIICADSQFFIDLSLILTDLENRQQKKLDDYEFKIDI